MIVGVGMLFQFSLTLSRFLNRQQSVLLPEENATAGPAPTNTGGKAAKKAPASKSKAATEEPVTPQAAGSRKMEPLHWALGVALVLLCTFWIVGRSAAPRETKGEYNYYAAGQIPVVYGGRVQPLDSMARNQLRIIQGKQEFQACMTPEELADNWADVRGDLLARWPGLDVNKLDTLISQGNGAATVDHLTLLVARETEEDSLVVQRYVESIAATKQPAMRWLLDVMVRPQLALKHRVFRIENIDLVDQLGLEHRSGLRYSYEELYQQVPGEDSPTARDEETATADEAQPAEDQQLALEREFESIRGLEASEMTLYQRKVQELQRKVTRLNAIFFAARTAPIGETPLDQQQWLADLEQNEAPLLVPPYPLDAVDKDEWQLFPMFANVELDVMERSGGESEFHPPVADLLAIYRAYAEEKPDTFNRAVEDYLDLVDSSVLGAEAQQDLRRESYFNHFEPFYLAAVLYFSAFLLVAISWLISGLTTYEDWQEPSGLLKQLINPQSLRLAAVAIIGLAFVLHSWALWQRMLISGRPPVTNLYSSAVFIGWAAIILCMVLEYFFRRGLGAALAAWAGFSTLLIANFLTGTTADTFAVMQAVLDTQFWLATHVVCVTLGYATTFIAGLLGIVYILGGLSIENFAKSIGKDLARMIYGILCFAIFFSFVGTVLGGLWADDSWGRFWGWDPKENGALIIVLWNALILHARWGGMVRDRGLAVLAVAGNITTSWSWFGVNELGIGLHSYGFTEGVLAILGMWCLGQLAVIAAGSIPKKYWRGFQSDEPAAEA